MFINFIHYYQFKNTFLTLKMSSKLKTPINNGAIIAGKYYWTQNFNDITIFIPVDDSIKSKDIKVVFKPNSINVILVNNTINSLLSGDLFNTVKTETSTWYVERNTVTKKCEIVIELDKYTKKEWWKFCLKGEDEIDTEKVVEDNVLIADLDSQTRMDMDKMQNKLLDTGRKLGMKVDF
jgi:hypothetical protein